MEQLHRLEVALAELLPVARRQSLAEVEQYEWALERARWLLLNRWTQDDLTELGRQVPDAFVRHKDWVPPLEQRGDGRWEQPAWFQELEDKLQPALRAARVLPEIGFY